MYGTLIQSNLQKVPNVLRFIAANWGLIVFMSPVKSDLVQGSGFPCEVTKVPCNIYFHKQYQQNMDVCRLWRVSQHVPFNFILDNLKNDFYWIFTVLSKDLCILISIQEHVDLSKHLFVQTFLSHTLSEKPLANLILVMLHVQLMLLSVCILYMSVIWLQH